jgi:hypothetical protein
MVRILVTLADHPDEGFQIILKKIQEAHVKNVAETRKKVLESRKKI